MAPVETDIVQALEELTPKLPMIYRVTVRQAVAEIRRLRGQVEVALATARDPAHVGHATRPVHPAHPTHDATEE